MTTSHTDAIRSVLSTGVFFITPQAAAANMPLVLAYMKGQIPDHKSESEPWRAAMSIAKSQPAQNAVYTPRYTYGQGWSFPNLDNESNGICLLPLEGVIMKQDGWCSNGMLTFVQWLRLAEQTDNINCVVVKCDSPGGDAMICEYVEKQIQSMSKPVLFHAHGWMASACYYMGSAATAIYCEGESDIIGSIGSMCTIADYNAYMAKEGLPIHEIYADGSEEKNLPYNEALKGEYQMMRDKMINPLRNQFVTVVQKNRPQVAESALKGACYFGAEAQTLGLIDGIQPFTATLAKAYNLGLEYSQSKKNK